MDFFCGLLLCAMLLLVSASSNAQEDPPQTNTNVNVVQEFKPVVADGIKIQENPEILDSVPDRLPVKLDYLDRKVFVPFIPSPVAPAKMKGEPLPRLYPFYMKAGYGLYRTGLAELSASTLRSKKWNGSIHARHFSSKGELEGFKDADFADNDIRANGMFLLENHRINTSANYYHHKMRYYGGINRFETSPVVFGLQHYQKFGASATLIPVREKKAQNDYDATLNYYNFRALSGETENHFSISGKAARFINDELIGVRIGYHHYGSNLISRSVQDGIFRLNPFASTSRQRWEGRIGLLYAIESADALTHYYPDLFFRYHLVKDLVSVYAELNGDVRKNSLEWFSSQNPFVSFNNGFVPRNTSERMRLNGGIRGNFFGSFGYHLAAGYIISDSIPLFVNRPLNLDSAQSFFIPLYESMNTFRLIGELSFVQGKRMNIKARAVLNQFSSLSSQAEAWQQFPFTFNLNGQYNLFDKLSATLDVTYFGPRHALRRDAVLTAPGVETIVPTTQKINGFVDVNVSAEYQYTRQIGVFIQFNNLVANRYYWWTNYPLQRFTFLGGLKITF